MPFDGSTFEPTPVPGFFARLRQQMAFSKSATLFAPDPKESIRDILTLAKSLISDPNDWCQGDFRNAHQRCAIQAVFDAANAFELSVAQPVRLQSSLVMHHVARCHGYRSMQTMNDLTNHRNVMRAFKEAITALQ